MLKCLITAGAYTSGNVPVTEYKNTNSKYQLNSNNTIYIKIEGLTDVKANLIFTATSATAVTLQLYANGAAVPGAIATVTPVSGNTYTLNINDVVKTALTADAQYVALSLQISEECTIVGGDVICEYLK